MNTSIVVEAVEDDIDDMENAVFTTEKSVDIEQIYLLKREILGLRRAVSPLTPAVRALAGHAAPAGPRRDPGVLPGRRGSPVGGGGTGVHLRRDADHTGQAALAEVTTRQNEDMRKISAWAAIALVPTAIAGIYGMNFEHMPELTWTYGYPMALGLIARSCASSLFMLLRRRGWL